MTQCMATKLSDQSHARNEYEAQNWRKWRVRDTEYTVKVILSSYEITWQGSITTEPAWKV